MAPSQPVPPATPLASRLPTRELLRLQAGAGALLDLCGRGIDTFPSGSGLQPNAAVRHLLLSDNHLTVTPDALLRSLPQLLSLAMDRNDLRELPMHFAGLLPHVSSLDLRNNELRFLPPSIGGLSQLRELLLDNNKLQDLPTTIGDLIHLETLHVDSNRLTALPNSLG